jgi:hypothetical protein
MAAKKTTLADLVAHLRASEKFHLEVGQKIAKADHGNVYPVDLLANAVLHRSTNLIRGFTMLVEQRNFVCAAALLRLQIDNCLRFYAVFIVKEPHDFAMEVFKGTLVRKLRDKTGTFMTDAYLVAQLSRDYPWVARVYKQTSGYIHLSTAHIFNTFVPPSSSDAEERLQTIFVGAGDCFPDDELYKEATAAFIEATQVLFKHVVGWLVTKEGPPPTSNQETKSV